MDYGNGLVFAYLLDGQGGGTDLDLAGVEEWTPSQGLLWLHLDYTGSDAQNWLQDRSGLGPVIVEALTAEETRPRSLLYKGGMLLILRGVNLNPGHEPEDMISIRLWIDSDRIITLRHRRVLAVEDLRQMLERGEGFSRPGEFLEELSGVLVERMGDVVSEEEDAVDALEDEVLKEQNYGLRQKIADVRRTAIGMRRYLAPQRDVMARLHSEKVDWLTELDRMRLRELADRTTRCVEDLDAIRERATVTHEELNGRLAEQMNKTMYVLSIVAGIFLPLGLMTGLLGINVGGIPGAQNPLGFTIFCFLLVAIAGIQVWLFKRMKWM